MVNYDQKVEGENAVALNAGIVQDLTPTHNEDKVLKQPFNALTVFNKDATVILEVMLDSYRGQRLSYWVYPNGVMVIAKIEKIIFHNVFIKNTHASSNVAIGGIKVVCDNL